MRLPSIAITIGDPAGIGPEISLRAANHPEVRGVCRPVLVGDSCVLESIAPAAGFHGKIQGLNQTDLSGLAERPLQPDSVEVLETGFLDKPIELGKPSAAGGHASYAAIAAAIRNTLAGHFCAVATSPINKYALKMAGIDFIGHTEIFGTMTNTPSYAMMMYSDRIAIGLATCHIPLSQVPGALRAGRIAEVGKLLSDSIARIRGTAPRIAVLGLNPHAGEEGLLGKDEQQTVIPAIAIMRQAGLDATGPLPPDTAFTKAALQRYDAHLCLYHDQGLIPFKMLSFEDGVNVTLGLPFPRTSVDHGTAYDLAGTGKASITSLVAAIKLAARLA